MSRPTRAVIFDMDGVIVDSEPRHERAFLAVVKAIGYGDRHGITFADYVGRSDMELWVDFVARHQPAEGLQQLLAMKRERVVEIIRSERPLFEGLKELVAALAPDYLLGLASGSERAIVDEVLKLESLGSFFSATVSGSEIKLGKPEPEIFLKTAELLGVEPSACWVVEDSKPGVAAGLAAGMRVIAITNTHPADELRNAHFVVAGCSEIAEVLRKHSGAEAE